MSHSKVFIILKCDYHFIDYWITAMMFQSSITQTINIINICSLLFLFFGQQIYCILKNVSDMASIYLNSGFNNCNLY